MALPESVVAAAREAPPKPTRIRTATNTSASSVEATASGNTSPDAKAPAPFPQPVHHRRAAAQGGLVKVNALHEHRMFARGRDESGNGCSEKDQQHSDSSTEPATLITSENGSSGSSTGSAAPTQLLANKKPPPVPISKRSQDGTSRAAVAPLPPPKPKRISLAPQPKAKPLSLQSAPLQPRAEHLARPDAASVTQAVSAAVDPTASTAKVTQIPASFSTSTKIQLLAQSLEASKPGANTRLVEAPRSPPVKKPRSTETSLDGSTFVAEAAQPQSRNRKHTHSPTRPIATSSSPTTGADVSVFASSSSGESSALINARSKLRSTSDKKTSTSPTLAYPPIARPHTTSTPAFGDDLIPEASLSKSHGPFVMPTYPPYPLGQNDGNGDLIDDEQQASAAPAAALAASLHKIQALAQGQTERMKQINYSEKKADLAEVVYEKSSLWRARGAEWSGIAKKAWDDRGGMGGIAGGLADRWKRKADGMNEGMPEYSRNAITDRIFGLPLEDAVKFSKISASTGVPAVVTRCIEYLDIMGVEEVGLYRVSGSTTNVARLKAMFDHGQDYDFLQKGNEPQNPHDVATLLKLYLRELPSPIIPQEIMPSFNCIDFSGPQKHRVQALRSALRLLPLENYILLGSLSQHLSNLAEYENCTKMNISNLGLIFCPTLQIGSVLFKNLLGGDEGESERRANLLQVWEDLDRKHEEMENLEMIKDFETGLHFEKNGDGAFVDAFEQEQERQRAMDPRTDGGPVGDQATRQMEGWEDIDRDLLDFGSSPALTTAANASTQSKGGSESKTMVSPLTPPTSAYNAAGTPVFNTPKLTEPAPDLYDELMTRELNEATNTPLIDLGLDEDQDPDPQEFRWRRHAREPAINRLSDSPPRTTARHERLPAVSLRF
ncbi:hypothetical protein BGZ72_001256 [Mortierella alpina]|nr:hypothetical protein BGZ72_001256 [Mortierella alpina]